MGLSPPTPTGRWGDLKPARGLSAWPLDATTLRVVGRFLDVGSLSLVKASGDSGWTPSSRRLVAAAAAQMDSAALTV